MSDNKFLKPCRDCEHQISKEALICSNCGRRVTFVFAVFFAQMCVLAVFVIIGVMLWIAVKVWIMAHA
jgi:uncharacterized membrane protein